MVKKNQIVDTIPVGDTPRRIVVNPNTNLLYVSNQIANSLTVIDGATNQVIDSIPVEQPYEIMINPKTNKIYSTYYGYSMLSIVNEDGIKPESSEKYETIIVVLGAGALAGGIAFLIIQKKKKLAHFR